MYNKNSYICMGIITSAHGIRGGMKVLSYTTKPNDIINYGTLFYLNPLKKLTLSIIGYIRNHLIVKIEGIKTRNEAEKLRNTKLYILRQNLPILKDENEFYISDLMNLKVYDLDGSIIGNVIGIVNCGTQYIIDISINNNLKKSQILTLPFTKDFFPHVNLNRSQLILNYNIHSF